MTVTSTRSNFWSIVAVTNAKPGPTAVTRPVVAFTVATSGREVVHATVRPVSTVPAASRAVAVSAMVAPTESEGLSGAIETELAVTGGAVVFPPPHAASAVARARQPADLRTSTLLREARTDISKNLRNGPTLRRFRSAVNEVGARPRYPSPAERVRTGRRGDALVH